MLCDELIEQEGFHLIAAALVIEQDIALCLRSDSLYPLLHILFTQQGSAEKLGIFRRIVGTETVKCFLIVVGLSSVECFKDLFLCESLVKRQLADIHIGSANLLVFLIIRTVQNHLSAKCQIIVEHAGVIRNQSVRCSQKLIGVNVSRELLNSLEAAVVQRITDSVMKIHIENLILCKIFIQIIQKLLRFRHNSLHLKVILPGRHVCIDPLALWRQLCSQLREITLRSLKHSAGSRVAQHKCFSVHEIRYLIGLQHMLLCIVIRVQQIIRINKVSLGVAVLMSAPIILCKSQFL